MQEEEKAHGLVTAAVVTLLISPKPAEAFCMCSDEEKEKAHRGHYKGPPGSHWCWLCFKKKDLEKCNKIWGNTVLGWERYRPTDIWKGQGNQKGKKRITFTMQEDPLPTDSPRKKKQKQDGHDDLPLPAPVAPAKAKAIGMLRDLVNVLEEINEEKAKERAVVLKKLQKRQNQEVRALQLLASPQAVAGRGLQTELEKRMQVARLLGSRWPKNRKVWTEEDRRSFRLSNALQLEVAWATKKNCWRRGRPWELFPAAMSKGERSDLLIALDPRVDECQRDA